MPDIPDAVRRQSAAMSAGYQWLFGAVPESARIGPVPPKTPQPRNVSGGVLAGTRDTLDAMASDMSLTRSRLIGRLLEARACDLDAVAASCQRLHRSPDGKIITVSGVIPAELRWSIIRVSKSHGVPVARIVSAVIEAAVEGDVAR